MEIIERYIYEVTSRLSEKNKNEIEKEIRSLIEDMMDDLNEGTEAERAYKVLKELGAPEILAEKYNGKERYLIGPKYFNKYILVLKIVLCAIFIGITVSAIVTNLMDLNNSIPNIIVEYIAMISSAALQGAAWVTIIFAIIEYNGIDINSGEKLLEWNPHNLPKIPNKKALIPISEPIVGIIFTCIFFVIVYFVPEIFAVYFIDGDVWTITPFFNIEVLKSYSVLVIVLFIIGILRELFKLILGRWTVKLSVIYSILSAISAFLMIKLFSNIDIWNIKLIEDSAKFSNIPWNYVLNGLVVIVIFVTAIDIIVTLYKGVRYGKE